MRVPKLLLPLVKNRIVGPKTAIFGPKKAFVVILGQILAFLLVGSLVVVVHGLYLARHLFTLSLLVSLS